MVNIKFEPEKALEAILYVASRSPIPDVYRVIKSLYFADMLHLEKYGRMITGDRYIAMPYGPVASGAFDIIKIARGDGSSIPSGLNVDDTLESMNVVGDDIKIVREYNDDTFSDSDIECLDEAISMISSLSFGQICEKSHGSAWKSAGRNGEISLMEIAKECDSSGLLIDYLMCRG